MAETSGFFEAELNEETGQWDREYFAHQFASYFKLFFGNGVFGSPTNQLKVLAGDGLKVIVKAGWAFIEGYWYFNEADLELTIEPNVTAFDRQDSIMCRLDMASKKITSVALAGVTDVVRDGNYYDLKLASVIVGVAGTSVSNANIVDTRTDQTVCGLVTGVMKVQPTADLFAQFTAQFNLWFETIKGQLSEDAAGNLQNQIGSLPDLETSVKSSLVEAINELTQKEVDVLDTYEEIMANTTPGKAAGGVGVKQGFTQLNDSLNNMTLLLSQTTTEEIEKTISNLSEYRSLLIVNFASSGSITFIIEIPITIMKKYPNTQIWCDGSNNTNRSSVKYISDTSIKIYATCANVEIYGIG